MKQFNRVFVFVLVIYLFSSPAWGQNSLDFQISNTVLYKQQKPSVTVTSTSFLKFLKVSLKRNDGRRRTFTVKNLPPGQSKEISWREDRGIFKYQAQFKGVFADGGKYFQKAHFPVYCLLPPKIKVFRERFSPQEHKLIFSFDRKMANADLLVFFANGEQEETQIDLASKRANTPVTMTWQKQGEVNRLELKVTGPQGFYNGVNLTPFMVKIPHQEVVFQSGSAKIEKIQEPKLLDSINKIKELLAKHSRDIDDIRLYIAGYTDTVGDRKYNQGLSCKRAKSIAAYFRRQGVSIKIYYQGFGESVLAEMTPDETDSEKNRRVIYLLTSYPPAKGNDFPTANWKRL